jgi:hypothetical protein
MFGSESKKEHQQIVDPEGEKCTMFFYGTWCFIQVGSVIHNFNFMNHLILLVYLGLDYKQHDDTH